MSVSELVNFYRVERAKALLAAEPRMDILEFCLESGFAAQSTFNVVFRKALGMTPSEYRALRALEMDPLANE